MTSVRLAILGLSIGMAGAQTAVPTVTDLLALRKAPATGRVTVAGYRRAKDDGGGVFAYVAGSTADADGGTTLAPANLPGRFLRVVAEDANPRAEWFGAYGDGRHADQAAINACLARFKRVKLLPKTYALSSTPTHYDPDVTFHSIHLETDYRIEGSGRTKTTLRLLDGVDPKSSSDSSNYFILFHNKRFHTPADRVIVRDLTIDCNFDGQNKHSTIHAIHIRGGDGLVERVNLKGYGTGRHPKSGYSRECFVVAQTLVYKHATGSRKGATFRDLDFTAPGHNGDVGGHVAEITHIALGGANNFQDRGWILPQGKDPDYDPANGGENERNWWPTTGGLVENCRFHDMVYDRKKQCSPLHGITVGDCDGVVIRNNIAENFEGAAVFMMSWHHRNTWIHHNRFRNVVSGVALHVKGSKKKPIQCPKHTNTLVEENDIVLGQPKNHPYSPIGIQFYGQDIDTVPRLIGITVRQNRISGRAFQAADGKRREPTGIVFQVLRANLQDILIQDNVLDFPDVPQGSAYAPKVPHARAISYFPMARWKSDALERKVRFVGNVGATGKPVRPMLQDWYFKNPPTWGNPDGTTSPAPTGKE